MNISSIIANAASAIWTPISSFLSYLRDKVSNFANAFWANPSSEEAIPLNGSRAQDLTDYGATSSSSGSSNISSLPSSPDLRPSSKPVASPAPSPAQRTIDDAKRELQQAIEDYELKFRNPGRAELQTVTDEKLILLFIEVYDPNSELELLDTFKNQVPGSSQYMIASELVENKNQLTGKFIRNVFSRFTSNAPFYVDAARIQEARAAAPVLSPPPQAKRAPQVETPPALPSRPIFDENQGSASSPSEFISNATEQAVTRNLASKVRVTSTRFLQPDTVRAARKNISEGASKAAQNARVGIGKAGRVVQGWFGKTKATDVDPEDANL